LNTTPRPSSTPRLSLLALAKRETARRGLYSRFFRGPILGPDDVQSETVKAELSPATQQTPLHHDDAKKSRKQKRKIDPDEEHPTREECNEKRRREKRLRKEAEKAARKRERKDAKKKAKDRKDEDIASSTPVDERVLSPSQEQRSGSETQSVKTEKKTKELKPTPVSTEKTLEEEEDHVTSMREDCSERSRKRRRRDQGL